MTVFRFKIRKGIGVRQFRNVTETRKNVKVFRKYEYQSMITVTEIFTHHLEFSHLFGFLQIQNEADLAH